MNSRKVYWWWVNIGSGNGSGSSGNKPYAVIRPLWHYIDVIMTTMASQITSLTVVYSIVYSGADQRKHQSSRHWPLCGEFTGTGEFPAQMASNAENVSIWWRHHDLKPGNNHCVISKWSSEIETPRTGEPLGFINMPTHRRKCTVVLLMRGVSLDTTSVRNTFNCNLG